VECDVCGGGLTLADLASLGVLVMCEDCSLTLAEARARIRAEAECEEEDE